MKRILFLAALVLLLASPASAWRVYCLGGELESLESGSASCTPVSNDGASGGAAHTTRDCDTTTDEGFICWFNWTPDMPTSGSIAVEFEALGTVSGTTLCSEVSLGCSVDFDKDMTYGAVTNENTTVGTASVYTVDSASVAVPTGVAADDVCVMRLKRRNGVGVCASDDDVGGDVKYRAIRTVSD